MSRNGRKITRREFAIGGGAAGAASILLADTQAASLSDPLFPSPDAELPEGVHAVWELSKAFTEKSATRERCCLNGLWRWQPEAEPLVQVPADRWGWFKVPGSWPGISDYLHKDCQTIVQHPAWSGFKQADVSSAWYQREFTVPAEWSGRRITVRLEYINTFAACYIDGVKAGDLRFPAGELDISAYCKPGVKHLLSLRVQASPLKAVMLSYTDTNAARLVRGTVERRGLCGDVWLESSPSAARISESRVETFVSKKQVQVHVALDGIENAAGYSLQTEVLFGGKRVLLGATHALQSLKPLDGRYSFVESISPEHLWDIHTPQNQYTFVVSLMRNGKLQDQTIPVKFGYREFVIKGRDFYLNGTRIFLHVVPIDNAQVGAAWASYDGAKETLERFKSMGINCVYTHNYSSEPGAHLSFAEILRAADDVGVLVALAQPHFSNYEWKAADADSVNGYALHAHWYTQIAGSHPSVVMYAMSHNATGYIEEMNPEMMDGIKDPREDWGRNNSRLALRAEAIVKRFDESRVVYHHSSGNLGSMITSNFYVNLAPSQELCDWFEPWERTGTKPLLLCEYGVPCTWDWTMYRGWYKGKREWGSAEVPWELCLAEWNAQYLGDIAYKISDRERANLRWEAGKFRTSAGWHRWDFPTEVSSATFQDRNLVFAEYIRDNWRAYRLRGLSAFGPWEYEMYWTLKGDADRSRKQLPVDWQRLQRPGFSADYLDDRPSNRVLSYERSDWLPTPAGEALLRNNGPVLAFIAGTEAHPTSKEHVYRPGEKLEKLLVVINNSRVTIACDWSWTLGVDPPITHKGHADIETGVRLSVPIEAVIPANMAAGTCRLTATFRFNARETQEDAFDIHVLPARHSAQTIGAGRVALFDPLGETKKQIGELHCTSVGPSDDLSGFELLIIGKGAITKSGAFPDISAVKSGLKVLVMEQTAEALEQRLGFRVAEYGLRRMFQRVTNHPIFANLTGQHLRDWRGEATLLPPRLNYRIGDRYSPEVTWCGLTETRVWRAGCRGNVGSVLIEKPAAGDFTPLLDGGYGLQYAALLEYREGKGLVLFCQADVTGRSLTEPAAELLLQNILTYVVGWKPKPARETIYIGDDAGRAHLRLAGFSASPLPQGAIPHDALLVLGPGCAALVAGRDAEIRDWFRSGGSAAALGLTQTDADKLLPDKVEFKQAEHIAAHFEPGKADSWLAGISPADIHNRDPRRFPLVVAGAAVVGDGVLAANVGQKVVFSQLAPWMFSSSAPMNQKRTFRHVAFLTARLLGNLDAASQTALIGRFHRPARAEDKRWLEGLYLDVPEEWDDPYRFFGW